MKTTIIWILLILALLGTMAFLVSQVTDSENPLRKKVVEEAATSSAPITFDQATVYTCADGSVVAAAFKTGDTSVLEVSLPNANPVILNSVEAASGARYANDTGLAFWEKRGVVLVEQSGEVTYSDCIVGQAVPVTAVATSTNELAGTVWVWNETVYATGTTIEPNQPEDFVITFAENNRFSANTDCNNVGGSFSGGTNGAVSFSEMVSTLMACEGEVKEGDFISMLARVVSYRIEDTALILSLKDDEENGEMKFTKK